MTFKNNRIEADRNRLAQHHLANLIKKKFADNKTAVTLTFNEVALIYSRQGLPFGIDLNSEDRES